MDPKPQRSQRPSLLETDASTDAPESAPPTSLAGVSAGERSVRRGVARPWMWAALLVVVGAVAILALTFSGVFGGNDNAAAVSGATRSRGADASDGATADHSAANGVAGHAVIMQGGAAPESAAATVAAEGAVASANADTAALSKMFAPSSAGAPVRVVRHAPPASHDADVALLTDLLRHVESGTPAERKRLDQIRGTTPDATIEERMQACPAANTAAGLRCRQKLCVGNAGKSPACPEGAPGGLGAVKPSSKAGHAARAAPHRPDVKPDAARIASARPVTPSVQPVTAAPTKITKAATPPPPATPQVAVVKPAPAQPPKPAGATHGVNVVHMATPQYPVAAAREHTSGYATMEFTVGPSGSVSNVHVVASSPRGVFEQAAMQVIRESQFAPAMKNGQPVAAVARRRIDFTLSN